ncbi:acyl-CoA dehydrogenase family protein [Williamsia sp. MIQD14]|uniref:acyl-CoA dehydrogenase family protein n=1 Tax=Williamsia sp. MIQD14 TaxID=3425703 RepID=UPI003D9FC1DC
MTTSITGVGPTLPIPGRGDTFDRLRALTAATRADISTGRLLEAHVDAEAILLDLGATAPAPGERWGVWAAEGPPPALAAHPDPATADTWILTGTKPWCSGASGCTHALVTAWHDGRRALLAVALDAPGITVGHDDWHAAGMRATETHAVDFDATPASYVADADDYFGRAGFWHGAIGVAACWFGGAQRVAQAVLAHGRDDDVALMHRGAVEVALFTGETVLAAAAAAIDAAPDDVEAAQVLALRVRAHIESVAAEIIDRVGRSRGPGPLVADAAHSGAVADLTVYIRQSHAERDLIALGRLCADIDARDAL